MEDINESALESLSNLEKEMENVSSFLKKLQEEQIEVFVESLSDVEKAEFYILLVFAMNTLSFSKSV